MAEKVAKEPLEIILKTVRSLKEERRNRGNWTDDEWREEGILNTCEGLACFLSAYLVKQIFASVRLEKDLEQNMLDEQILDEDIGKLIENVKLAGFAPSPYFAPKVVKGEKLPDFTDTVSYVITTLLDYKTVLRDKGRGIPREAEIDETIVRGVQWLLQNQKEGGWSWGAYGDEHIYFTYSAIAGLAEIRGQISKVRGMEEHVNRIDEALNKAKEWLHGGAQQGEWREFGREGEAHPCYTAYALYALDLLNGDEALMEQGYRNLLQKVEDERENFWNPHHYGIKGDPWKVRQEYEDHAAPAITLQVFVNRFSKSPNAKLQSAIRILYTMLSDLRDRTRNLWREWGYRTYFNQAAIEALLQYAANPPFEVETLEVSTEDIHIAVRDFLTSPYFVTTVADLIVENIRTRLGLPPTKAKSKEIIEEMTRLGKEKE